MSFTSDKIAALSQRREKLLEGGGADRIEKQRAAGKSTARERLDILFDSGTFVEIDAFAESRAVEFGMASKRIPGDGVVAAAVRHASVRRIAAPTAATYHAVRARRRPRRIILRSRRITTIPIAAPLPNIAAHTCTVHTCAAQSASKHTYQKYPTRLR